MKREAALTSSVVALARALRERKTTSRELVEIHMARIRQVNPSLNAVVRDRFDDALREADEADRVIASSAAEDLPPLFGVPCTIKEAFAFEGMPNTSGHWARRDVIATEDATAVRRLRDAGAIPLGVTNVSELCMWMESSNRVWGRTNNAYDGSRTAGGSSGGEGAIVGAGGSPFGLGSDVGGSIRMPAFFNGVFGHKPTGGLVPSSGHHPSPEGRVQRYNTVGPLTRRAEDLMPILRVIAGPDGIQAGCTESSLGDPASVDVGKLTVFSIENDGLVIVDRALVEAQRRAAAALEARGAKIERRKIPALKHSLEIWSTMLHEGGNPPFRELMAAGGDFAPWRELARMPFGRSHYTLPGVLLAIVEVVPTLFAKRAREILDLGEELARELQSLLGDRALLLYPAHAVVAPRHGMPLLLPFRWVYTAIMNVMELPATAVPLGLDARGLPLGVQVVGPRLGDHMTIAAALALEESFGGWAPPSRFGAL